MRIFCEALLEGHSIAVCGPAPDAIRELLGSLGANVQERGTPPLDALVCAHRSDDGHLADIWSTVHAVATEVFIPAKRGRILLLAARGRGESARAGLENLARTLSVEWARFGITTVAIAPGAATSEDDLATLVAFLCSKAGAYYSGCCFDLR
jgi:hypothetical protein